MNLFKFEFKKVYFKKIILILIAFCFLLNLSLLISGISDYKTKNEFTKIEYKDERFWGEITKEKSKFFKEIKKEDLYLTIKKIALTDKKYGTSVNATKNHQDYINELGEDFFINYNPPVEHSIYHENYDLVSKANFIESTKLYNNHIAKKCDYYLRQDYVKENPYLTKVYTQSKEIYEKTFSQNFYLEDERGFMNYADYKLDIPILIFLVMLIAIFIYMVDMSPNAYQIINTCKKGGLTTYFNKIGLLIISTVGISLIFSLTKIILFQLELGLGNLSRPIQTIAVTSPYCISALEYILLNEGIILLFLLFVALITFFLILIFRNVVACLVSCGIILGGLYACNAFIQPGSSADIVKFLNPFMLINLKRNVKTLDFYNFFGTPVKYLTINVALILFLIVLLFVLSIFIYKIDKPVLGTRTNKIIFYFSKIFKKTSRYLKSKKYTFKNFYIIEFLKTVKLTKVILIIICFIFIKSGFTYINLQNKPDDYNLYKTYIDEFNTEVSKEKWKNLEKLNKKFDENKMLDVDDIEEMKRQGISQDEIDKKINEAYSIENDKPTFKKFYNQCKHVQSFKDSRVKLINEYDYGNILIPKFIDALMLIFMVLLFFKMFANEYETGIINITNPCKKGKMIIPLTKIISCFIILIGFFVVSKVIDYEITTRYLGIEIDKYTWACSLPQLSFVPINVTMTQFLMLSNIIEFLGMVSCFAMILLISYLCNRNLTSFIISILIIALPAIMQFFGLNIFNYFTFNGLINKNSLINLFFVNSNMLWIIASLEIIFIFTVILILVKKYNPLRKWRKRGN